MSIRMSAVVFHTLFLYRPHSPFINGGYVFINVKANGVFNNNIDVSLLAVIYNILF